MKLNTSKQNPFIIEASPSNGYEAGFLIDSLVGRERLRYLAQLITSKGDVLPSSKISKPKVPSVIEITNKNLLHQAADSRDRVVAGLFIAGLRICLDPTILDTPDIEEFRRSHNISEIISGSSTDSNKTFETFITADNRGYLRVVNSD